jgi:glycosyltransferase involved in cell wall biosynthesis
MRVLHVIDSLPKENGGMPAVVVRLAVAQKSAGLDPTIACHDEHELKEHVQWWSSQVLGFAAVKVIACGLSPANAAKMVRQYDVVHVHGVWMPIETLMCWQAERAGVPTLLAPHGMLSAWSLEQKRPRKALALALIWGRLVRNVTYLHALNVAEADELRARFPRTAIRVIPNGIFAEEFDVLPPPGESARVIPALGNRRRFVLFLARLHYMKAPDLLVDAFAKVAARHPDLDLVVAGPDYGMEPLLRSQIEQLGLAERVHLPGAVYGRAKLALLRDALCMCQPSRHEGFSVSMLEALACGLPVVTTKTANFPEIETEGAGIIAAPSAEALAAAMAEMVSNDELRAQRSQAARDLIGRRYTWGAVEETARAVYATAVAGAV